MKCRPIFWIVVIVAVCLLTGCNLSKVNKKESSFKSLVHLEQFGNDIKLDYWVPEDKNHLKIGESVTLYLENISDSVITFPYDYGIKLYTYDNNEWKQIGNSMIYSPLSPQIIRPKSTDSLGDAVISFFPEISSTSKPVTLRVLVVGTKEDPTLKGQTEVGAFLDVELKP